MNADPRTNYERERRFLVTDESLLELEGWSWKRITQAYLWAEDGYAVRIRLIQAPSADSPGILEDIEPTFTIKGPRIGDERFEYESKIPDMSIARSIIDLAKNVVVKNRYQIAIDGQGWDIDRFLGNNEGLIVAEIEGADIRSMSRPDWAAKEITTDSRFNNEELAKTPYSRWPENQKNGDVWEDL